MSVLIGTANPDLLAVLAYLLQRAGYDVATAQDGRAVVRWWQERQPDLLVIEADLPSVTGHEVCRIVRQKSASTGLILLQEEPTEADELQAFSLGADDFIRLPLSPALLVTRVQAVLRRCRHGSCTVSPLQ
jgi:two-component system alkaline phosphatase synthesis response regulator PhoP